MTRKYHAIVKTINEDYVLMASKKKENWIKNIQDVNYTEYWTGSEWSENQEDAHVYSWDRNMSGFEK